MRFSLRSSSPIRTAIQLDSRFRFWVLNSSISIRGRSIPNPESESESESEFESESESESESKAHPGGYAPTPVAFIPAPDHMRVEEEARTKDGAQASRRRTFLCTTRVEPCAAA